MGEKMENERYRITGYHGKGVYSQVLKAVDQEDGSEVAIKVSRNKYTMYVPQHSEDVNGEAFSVEGGGCGHSTEFTCLQETSCAS